MEKHPLVFLLLLHIQFFGVIIGNLLQSIELIPQSDDIIGSLGRVQAAGFIGPARFDQGKDLRHSLVELLPVLLHLWQLSPNLWQHHCQLTVLRPFRLIDPDRLFRILLPIRQLGRILHRLRRPNLDGPHIIDLFAQQIDGRQLTRIHIVHIRTRSPER